MHSLPNSNKSEGVYTNMGNINEKIRRYSVLTFSTLIICILFISNSTAADEVIEINEIIIPATGDYVKQISDLEIGDELLVNVEVTGGSIDVILREGNSDVATETIEETGTLTYTIEYVGDYELVFENKNLDEVYLNGSIEITNTTAEAGGSGLTLTEIDSQESEAVQETLASEEAAQDDIATQADMAAEESGPTTPGFGILTTVLAFCGLLYGLRKR